MVEKAQEPQVGGPTEDGGKDAAASHIPAPQPPTKPPPRPEFILSALGDMVFDGDEWYEELLADWRAQRGLTPDMIEISLTRQQAEKLSDILNSTTDEGPHDEGWPSGALCELRSIVDCAIEMAQKLGV